MPNIYDPIKVDDDYFPQHEAEQETFYQQLNVLPRNVADILLIPETSETLEKISKENQLSASQSQELSRLVRKITIADIYLGDIVKETQNKLSINEVSAKELANVLISEIFYPVLEELKKLHIEKFGSPSHKATESETKKEGVNNPNNLVNLRNK